MWEGLAVVVAVLAAAISVVQALRASQAAERAEAAASARAQARLVMAVALDAGNRLLEEMRLPDVSGDELVRRVTEFEHQASAAVEMADRAQLPRYHRPLQGPSTKAQIQERVDRLQEIQDRL